MNGYSLEKIEKVFKNRKSKVIGKHKFFSILVPIVEKEGELFLLYEIRSQKLGRQPGEVCFPGGQKEEGESSKECAIRETCEELGVARTDINVISSADRIHSQTNFTMECFLGTLDISDMEINEDEVGDTFLVPLDFLLENPPEIHFIEMMPNREESFPYEKVNFPEGYKWRRGLSEVPIYEFEDKVIWGLTALITHNFIKILKGEIK